MYKATNIFKKLKIFRHQQTLTVYISCHHIFILDYLLNQGFSRHTWCLCVDWERGGAFKLFPVSDNFVRRVEISRKEMLYLAYDSS